MVISREFKFASLDLLHCWWRAGDSGKKRTFDFAIIAGLDARVTAGTGAAAGAYEGIWRMNERLMTRSKLSSVEIAASRQRCKALSADPCKFAAPSHPARDLRVQNHPPPTTNRAAAIVLLAVAARRAGRRPQSACACQGVVVPDARS